MSDINEYSVQGMTCSSCASKVSTAVKQVPGVITTDVDLSTGTLRVTGPAVDSSAVRTAITDAGYQVS
ncbi:heavy-metal-associated domain-containing protein [Nocardioides antri]|uniref:Heavy-metal-associated domain-containing protein n=1 Tax=Nocardioides antri TaxID=2607659 RepID=A0A5B1M4Z8_9ACTN|nr:heavy metal-associated domain-containing protein [Nocardioides antri]KAA1426780.1 heavy-metal-associated domain-containing protein [Nocardioides antri]